MSVAYSETWQGGFEDKALKSYADRARLTQLLTLQQDLLAFAIRDGDDDAVLDNVIERVKIAFGADACILSLDADVVDAGPSGKDQVFALPSGSEDALYRLPQSTEICITDGPLRPDATQKDDFVWCWIEPIRRPDASGECGRIVLLFREECAPSEEERLALQSIGLHIHLLIQSVGRKRALQSANERFTSLTSSIPGVVYQRVVRPDGDIRYTYISESAEELFGVPAHEIISNPRALFRSYAPEYAETFRKRLLEASKTLSIWDVEASIITPDGKKKYTHAIARPTRQPDGSVLWTGVILDASRIKKAEQEAAATADRTRRGIVESLPLGFLLFDNEGTLVLRNNQFETVYPEMAEIAVPGVRYEDIMRAELNLHCPIGADQPDIETQLMSRIAHHLAEEQFSIERQVGTDAWILMTEKHTLDGGTVILYTDITSIKRHELEVKRHAQQLERVNAELQQFAYVASHDLQEPLRKIEAFGDRLLSRCADHLDDKGELYVNRMMDASGRMRLLINDLLSYSRVGREAAITDIVDLNALASDVISDLEESIDSKSGTVEIGPLPEIQANRTLMRQLFQNIISNSLKYSDPERPPHVRITASPGDGNQFEISFSDNGIGFESKYAERIFEVFQRLHGRTEYAGTGIGLATVRRIVEGHNGSVRAESVVGQGTVFRVVLPQSQPEETVSSGETER